MGDNFSLASISSSKRFSAFTMRANVSRRCHGRTASSGGSGVTLGFGSAFPRGLKEAGESQGQERSQMGAQQKDVNLRGRQSERGGGGPAIDGQLF